MTKSISRAYMNRWLAEKNTGITDHTPTVKKPDDWAAPIFTVSHEDWKVLKRDAGRGSCCRAGLYWSKHFREDALLHYKTLVDYGLTLNGLITLAQKAAKKDKAVERRFRHWLADCAAHVLHIYEDAYPRCDAPRDAVTNAREIINTGDFNCDHFYDWPALRAVEKAQEYGNNAAAYATTDFANGDASMAAGEEYGAPRSRHAESTKEMAWQLERLVLWLSDDEPEVWPLPDRPMPKERPNTSADQKMRAEWAAWTQGTPDAQAPEATAFNIAGEHTSEDQDPMLGRPMTKGDTMDEEKPDMMDELVNQMWSRILDQMDGRTKGPTSEEYDIMWGIPPRTHEGITGSD